MKEEVLVKTMMKRTREKKKGIYWGKGKCEFFSGGIGGRGSGLGHGEI